MSEQIVQLGYVRTTDGYGLVISMVLKTGLDRPVQPGTGVQSGPVL